MKEGLTKNDLVFVPARAGDAAFAAAGVTR